MTVRKTTKRDIDTEGGALRLNPLEYLLFFKLGIKRFDGNRLAHPHAQRLSQGVMLIHLLHYKLVYLGGQGHQALWKNIVFA